jgi:hypothetical protein
MESIQSGIGVSDGSPAVSQTATAKIMDKTGFPGAFFRRFVSVAERTIAG